MKSRKQKKKDMHDNKCRKGQKERRKKKRRNYTKSKSGTDIVLQGKGRIEYLKHNFVVPETFSIENNTEESLKFFVDMHEHVDKMPKRTKFFIDSSGVSSVTVDALVFLIAIMRNTKACRKKLFSFRGNFPSSEYAKRIYEESGFRDFVYSQMKRLPPSNEKMNIISGNSNDPYSAKTVSQFIMEKLELERTDIIDVQKILIELMSNVYAHAYKNDEIMEPCWYIYAEHNVEDSVRIIFADTGLGITKTVRRKWHEKILGRKDCELLESAFSTQEFRTETKKKNRGNGLPGIKDIVLNGNFRNFLVLTGSGELKINKIEKEKISKIEHNNKINGTLYMFDFIKKEAII